MQIIKHRVNTMAELKQLPAGWGAEIDLRSRGNEIILHHEPFSFGGSFGSFANEWAAVPNRGMLIINLKEDGIETKVLDALAKSDIKNFFFLDLAIPTTVNLAFRRKISKIAVRVSEYEPVEAALCFENKVQWVWLDCFGGTPPPPKTIETLKGKFKLCLASPELHGFPTDTIASFRSLSTQVDAVCTRHPDLWQT